MIEIIRALTPRETGCFPSHHDKIFKPDQREIYRTVGEHLIMTYELAGELEDEGTFLLRLEDGRSVEFSYETIAIGEQIDTDGLYIA